MGENLPANVGDAGLIPGLGRSLGEGNDSPFQCFFPGKFHGQRSLVGCGLWDHKEPDMTEHARPHSVSNIVMIVMLDTIICNQ